jgi:large subunit ribosomal protein L29
MAKLTKIDDIRRLTDDQIEKRLAELAKEQMNIRFRKATNQLDNTTLNRYAKREVAQIKTIQNERRLLAASKGV